MPTKNLRRITQPLDKIIWRHVDELTANNYNPNHVAPPELALIRVSIIEDGWTAPIVVTPELEIVDGFHRALCVKTDPDVYRKTGGMVPTVEIRPRDNASQMMATIRHNRARGTHAVLDMSKIIQTLVERDKMPLAEICDRLKMESEEVIRLAARVGIPQSAIIAATGWSKEWKPTRNGQK